MSRYGRILEHPYLLAIVKQTGTYSISHSDPRQCHFIVDLILQTRVTAGPFQPDSRTYANLAEGR
jgi:hypothetical protein